MTTFTAVPMTPPQAQTAAAGAYTAAQANVTNAAQLDPTKAVTAEERLGGILNSGSKLMQSAATQGNASAAQRGLLNSSMGIQAAQAAMIDRAAPIATADAASLNNMGQFNANNQQQVNLTNAQAQNRGSEFNANSTNTAEQFNTNQSNAMNQWNAGQANDMTRVGFDANTRQSLAVLDANSRESLANLDAQTRTNLANIEANYKTLLQTNASAASIYETYLKNLTDLSASDKFTDPAAKQIAMENQRVQTDGALKLIGTLGGVSDLLKFTSSVGTPAPAAAAAAPPALIQAPAPAAPAAAAPAPVAPPFQWDNSFNGTNP